MLVGYPKKKACPKVLINRENTKGVYDFTKAGRIFLEGDSDATVKKIVKDMGWQEEFDRLSAPKDK